MKSQQAQTARKWRKRVDRLEDAIRKLRGMESRDESNTRTSRVAIQQNTDSAFAKLVAATESKCEAENGTRHGRLNPFDRALAEGTPVPEYYEVVYTGPADVPKIVPIEADPRDLAICAAGSKKHAIAPCNHMQDLSFGPGGTELKLVSRFISE